MQTKAAVEYVRPGANNKFTVSEGSARRDRIAYSKSRLRSSRGAFLPFAHLEIVSIIVCLYTLASINQ